MQPVWRFKMALILLKKMVLPDRIELSTSPLPMECSTTELRQHAPDHENRPKGPLKAGRSLPQGPRLRKREARLWDAKNRPIGAEPPAFAVICRYCCKNWPCPLEQWRKYRYCGMHLGHRSRDEFEQVR